MLDTLLKTTDDAICVLDGQGTFRSMNDSAAAQVGGRPEDYVGKTVWSVFPPELAALFTSYVRQVIETRKGLVTETRQPLQNGWRWHRTVVEPLTDADGNVSTVLMMARDITAQKNAEEERKKSEIKYQTLIEQIPAIIYTTTMDRDFSILFVSPQVTELLGFSPDECRNDPGLWQRQLHPDDRERLLREWDETRQTGRPSSSEYRLIAKSGSVKWFRDDSQIILAPDGRPLCHQGVMLDITEQKSAHEAARRTDEQFRRLFDSSPIGMLFHDFKGKLVSSNSAARDILGLPEVRENRNFSLLSDPQLPAGAAARLQAGDALRFVAKYDFDRVRRDQLHDTTRTGFAYFDTLMIPLTDDQTGERTGYLVQIQDISEQKHNQESARRTEKRFHQLFMSSPIDTEYYDALGKLVEGNPAAHRTYGVSNFDDVRGMDLFANPNFPEEEKARLMATGSCRFELAYDFDLIRANNYFKTSKTGVVHIDAQVTRLTNEEDGMCAGYLVQAQDITKRKTAEEAARRSDAMFRQLYSCSPIGMTIFDSRGRFLDANPAARQLFGVPEHRDILGYELLSDPRLSSDIRARLRAGESVRYETAYDFDWVRKERLHNTTRTGVAYFDTVITPLIDGLSGECNGYLVQVQDITERKAAENSARRADEQVRQVFACSPIGMTLFDAQGRFVNANHAAKEIFGIREDRKDVGYSIFHDPMFAADALERLKGGKAVRFESVYDFDRARTERLHDTRRTGIAYLDFSITPLSDSQTGECIGFVSQVQDITERRIAEMQVAKLSEQRQLSLDAAGMGWWHYDLTTKTFKFDDRVRTLFELKGNQATSDEIFSRIHPDDFVPMQAKAVAALAMSDPQPYSIDYRIRLSDGTERWIENFNDALFEGEGASRRPVGLFGTSRDITNRKRSEQALQQSERQARESFEELQKLMDIAPVAILVANDPECKSVSANPAAKRMMKIPDPEGHITALSVPFPPQGLRFFKNDNEIQIKDLPLHLATMKGLHVHGVETNILAPSGRITTMLESARPLFDASGQIRGGICVVMDITERKRIENALRESRQEFADLMQALEDGVWAATSDGHKLLYINPAMERIYGRTQVELTNADLWMSAVHPDDVMVVRESLAQILNTGNSDLEYRIVRPNGDIRWVRDRKTVVRDAKGRPLQVGGIVRDVTNRKEAEERARLYEQDLRSLTHQILRVEEAERAQLAVDLHDGLTQLLSLTRMKMGALGKNQSAPEEPQRLDEIRSLIDQAIHEARVLTGELCPPVLHELGLHAAASWLAEQMKQRFGLEVRVEAPSQWKPLPKASSFILFRCLRELLINIAKHAHASLAQVRFVQSDHSVSLSVIDNGRGFKDGFIEERLPGSMGEGGFGLFSIRQRLAHLGGQLVIESQPGRGSIVRLDLPLPGESHNTSEKSL